MKVLEYFIRAKDETRGALTSAQGGLKKLVQALAGTSVSVGLMFTAFIAGAKKLYAALSQDWDKAKAKAEGAVADRRIAREADAWKRLADNIKAAADRADDYAKAQSKLASSQSFARSAAIEAERQRALAGGGDADAINAKYDAMAGEERSREAARQVADDMAAKRRRDAALAQEEEAARDEYRSALERAAQEIQRRDAMQAKAQEAGNKAAFGVRGLLRVANPFVNISTDEIYEEGAKEYQDQAEDASKRIEKLIKQAEDAKRRAAEAAAARSANAVEYQALQAEADALTDADSARRTAAETRDRAREQAKAAKDAAEARKKEDEAARARLRELESDIQLLNRQAQEANDRAGGIEGQRFTRSDADARLDKEDADKEQAKEEGRFQDDVRRAREAKARGVKLSKRRQTLLAMEEERQANLAAAQAEAARARNMAEERAREARGIRDELKQREERKVRLLEEIAQNTADNGGVGY